MSVRVSLLVMKMKKKNLGAFKDNRDKGWCNKCNIKQNNSTTRKQMKLLSTLRSRHCSKCEGIDMWELSSNVLSKIGTWSSPLSSVRPSSSSKLLIWLLNEQFCTDLSRYFVTVAISILFTHSFVLFDRIHSQECFKSREKEEEENKPNREFWQIFKVENKNEETLFN